MSHTGNDLRRARVNAGLSHAKLATNLGVSERTLYRYEADRDGPIDAPDRARLIVRAVERFINKNLPQHADGATS